MDEFVMRLIEMAPAVAVLIYIIIRQEQRNELLIKTLVDCFEDCHNHNDDEPKKEQILE